MPGDSVKVEMLGDRELKQLLTQMPKRVASKGNKAAVTAGAKPIRTEAKARAPRESGLLKKAISTRIKTYKGDTSTTAVAVTGARVDVQGDYKGKRRVPSKYLHLVEKGTSHSAANPFMQDAENSTKDEAIRLAGAKFVEVVEKEARKLGRI